MDEIIADACIFNDKNQQCNLMKIARNPSIHPFLISEWGMPKSLLDSLCMWSDVQSLLLRSTDQEITFKHLLARKMLVVAVALFKWFKVRCSFPKTAKLAPRPFSLPSDGMPSASADESEGLGGGGDAGGGVGVGVGAGALQREPMEVGDVSDGEDEMLDQDTETEQQEGGGGDNNDDSDDDGPAPHAIVAAAQAFPQYPGTGF